MPKKPISRAVGSLLVVLSAILASGLGSEAASAGISKTQSPPVTKEQAESFGREVARTLSAADPTFFNAHIDNDAIIDTAVSDLSYINERHRSFAPFNASMPFMWQSRKRDITDYLTGARGLR
jgi:hypothetical protein